MPYNFHDALLEDFQISPRQEVTLRIALYPNFYPGRLVVSVRFGAITNPDAVKTYFGKIDKPEPEEGFARIDALHYDTKWQSTQDRLYFYLQLGWEYPLNIHCGKFRQAELKPRRQPPPGKTAMQMIQGRWPGEETTEQLLAQLKALG